MASHEDEVDNSMANFEVQVKNEDTDVQVNDSPSHTPKEYIRGWRLYVITTW